MRFAFPPLPETEGVVFFCAFVFRLRQASHHFADAAIFVSAASNRSHYLISLELPSSQVHGFASTLTAPGSLACDDAVEKGARGHPICW